MRLLTYNLTRHHRTRRIFVASFTASLPTIFTPLPEITTELNNYINEGIIPKSTTFQGYIASVNTLAQVDKTITLHNLLNTPATKHRHLQHRLTKQLKDNHVNTTL